MKAYTTVVVVATPENEFTFRYAVSARTVWDAKFAALRAFIEDQAGLNVVTLRFESVTENVVSLSDFKEGDRVQGIVVELVEQAKLGTVVVVTDVLVIRWDGGPETIYGPEDIETFKIRKA